MFDQFIAALFLIGLSVLCFGLGGLFATPSVQVVDSAQLIAALRQAAPVATCEPRPVVRELSRERLARMTRVEIDEFFGRSPPRDAQPTISFRISRSDRSTITEARD